MDISGDKPKAFEENWDSSALVEFWLVAPEAPHFDKNRGGDSERVRKGERELNARNPFGMSSRAAASAIPSQHHSLLLPSPLIISISLEEVGIGRVII